MPKGIVALTSTTYASGRLLRPRLRSFAFGHNFPYRDKELDFSCCDTFLCVVFWMVAQSQATVEFIKHLSNLPYSCTLFQLEMGETGLLTLAMSGSVHSSASMDLGPHWCFCLKLWNNYLSEV